MEINRAPVSLSATVYILSHARARRASTELEFSDVICSFGFVRYNWRVGLEGKCCVDGVLWAYVVF